MANADEESRARRSIARGKTAAGMVKSGERYEKVRSYIATQGAEETKARTVNARIGKKAGFSTDPVSFKHGGKISKTGIYKLHKGETVVPAHKSHPCLDC